MRKLIIAACAAAMASVAEAIADIDSIATSVAFVPYAAGDPEPGEAHYSWYTSYVLDQAGAQAMLGADSAVGYSDVATWLGANFAQAITGEEGLSKYGAEIHINWFSEGYYACFNYVDASRPNAGIGAIAVVIFENDGEYAYMTLSNRMDHDYIFDPNVSTSVKTTEWTAATIPEPTSGLLLLLGVAGLALKRKQRG